MRSIKPKMNYLRKKRMKNAGDPKGFWGRYTLRGMNRDHQSLVQFGLAEVPVEADATCLDVGCGGGKTLSVLAKEAFRGNVGEMTSGELALNDSFGKSLPLSIYVRVKR